MAKKKQPAARRRKKYFDTLAEARQAAEKVFFEHVSVEKTPYEKTADRVLAAVYELNKALEEAHKCAEMRVFIGATARSADHPVQFEPQIYRLTHSTMAFSVNVKDAPEKMEWRQVKDARFQDAAGAGLRGLNKKT